MTRLGLAGKLGALLLAAGLAAGGAATLASRADDPPPDPPRAAPPPPPDAGAGDDRREAIRRKVERELIEIEYEVEKGLFREALTNLATFQMRPRMGKDETSEQARTDELRRLEDMVAEKRVRARSLGLQLGELEASGAEGPAPASPEAPR